MDGGREGRETSRAPAPLEAVLLRFAKAVRVKLRMHDLRRHGIDEDEVEQDIRIRLWSALRRDPSSDLTGAYVQKVILSAIIDALRRERSHRSELAQDLQTVESTHPDGGRPPELFLANAQWMELVTRCISQLPPRRRRPVQLHLLGYSMQELSDLNGLTLDAGSKLVRRGLADLRALLAQARDAT